MCLKMKHILTSRLHMAQLHSNILNMKIFKILLIVLSAVVVILIVRFYLLGKKSQQQVIASNPDENHLKVCYDKPNCVSTQDTRGNYKIDFSSLKSSHWPLIKDFFIKEYHATVQTETDTYLHLQIQSKIFGFVDDVEFLKTLDGSIEARSSSRVGRSDLGVNRKRLTELLEYIKSQNTP